MARPLPIEFPGAWYHVTSRGNERKSIFSDDSDRRKFLEIIASSDESYRVQVHAYVLMANHFHLLVMTPEANLQFFMQRLNTAYTVYFNELLPPVAVELVAEVVGEKFEVEVGELLRKRSKHRQARRFLLALCYDLLGAERHFLNLA